MGIKHRLLQTIKRHGQKRSPGADTFAKLADWYLRGYNNVDYDASINGEARVIDVVSRTSPKVIFDVGANVGDWTDYALENTQAEIHCFELAPPIFETLQKRFANENRVKLNAVGLSDENTEIDVRFAASNIGVTTGIIDKKIHDDAYKVIKGDVIAGDTYTEDHNIDHIDFIKIDVEGMEMHVLKGLAAALSSQSVNVLQFEYGMANIYSRYLLKDFHEFFESYGYVVGKVMPKQVIFRDYSPRDEDFRGPNFLAVRGNDKALIDALAGT